MFLNLEKREFQHFILQYLLANLQQYDDLMERSESEDDLMAEAGQWQEEDPVWQYFMNFLKRRNVENRLNQLWPRWEGRIKVMGPIFSQKIIDTRQKGSKSDNTIKFAI